MENKQVSEEKIMDWVKITTVDKQEIGRVIQGINDLADIMGVTLGAYGRNVLIQKRIKAITTKDGVTVAIHAASEDLYKNLGMAMLREISMATNFEVGDGTTTAALLGREIIQSGMEQIAQGKNPVVLVREIREDAGKILKKIDELKREIKSTKDIKHIATVSSGYKRIGEIIAQIYAEKGNDCNIVVERSKDEQTVVENVQGLKIDRTFVLPEFINQPNQTAVLENANVLIINKDNTVNHEFINAVDNIIQTTHNKNLLVFAKNLPNDVLEFLITNKRKGALVPVVIAVPKNIADVELVTGAEAISDRSTLSLMNFQMRIVGKAQKVICNNKYTTLIGDPAMNGMVRKIVDDLKDKKEKKEITHEDNLRLANLIGGISILKLGKETDLGWEELHYRVEDAIRATEMAVKYGIIEGEFQGLLKACEESEFFKPIVKKLIFKLCENAGADDQVAEQVAAGKGYNFELQQFAQDLGQDLYQMGIIDPVQVTKVSFRNAVNIGTIFLTTDGLIIDAKKLEKA